MDEIRDLNTTSGQSITAILPSTFKIFAPHLLKNKTAIKSIPSTTHAYGPHSRQELDVYRSPTDTLSTPILIFFHGGGLIRGDKISPQIPEGLVYANVGAFFAQRGITTVVPNYRRVDFQGGGEGAVFPSGGEDVGLVLEWLEGLFEEGRREVYLLGNSAGGIHVSTFLLHDGFAEQRKKYSVGNGKGKGIVLKGIADLAVPCHFEEAEESRAEVLKTYYGDEEDVKGKCVCGLLESVRKSRKGREELGIPKKMWMGIGEFDPEDEITGPMNAFAGKWKEAFGEEGLVVEILKGHNHISPPMSLMSGDKEGERWSEDFVKWIKDA
ncbi:alpha/beta-hydrolase [Cadophora sp. DSE1049]|nr:alpha/beta-hydrolase [Cadophora sp. DSE1049]